MREVVKRCQYCLEVYSYVASGQTDDEHNHHIYCPGCWEVIVKALLQRPVRIKKEWRKITTSIADLEMIAHKTNRVMSSTFNTITGESYSKRHYISDRMEFYYDEKEGSVYQLFEVGANGGKSIPWLNY